MKGLHRCANPFAPLFVSQASQIALSQSKILNFARDSSDVNVCGMEFSVLKVIVAFLFISIDIVVSPDKKANLDLLPDFIGYAILIYQFFKLWKDNSENDSLKVAAKQGMITAVITFVISYAAYILDMYGILYKINANIIVMLSAILELAFLLNIFMFIQNLSALQGNESNYQIKRMNMLWKIMFLCILCEYISMPIESVALTFFIFEKAIMVIFICYIFTSDMTYKKKLKEKSGIKKIEK